MSGEILAARMDALCFCVVLVGREKMLWPPLIPGDYGKTRVGAVLWSEQLFFLPKIGLRPSTNGGWGIVWKQLLRP